MKNKRKIENIFVVLSILFIFSCCLFYGIRFVKYFIIFNPEITEQTK